MTGPSTRLIGVYHADGSFMGELRYAMGLFRGVHCSLCDISHGGVRMKEAFRQWMESRSETVKMLHLDEQPSDLAAFTLGQTPCLVLDRGAGWEMLLGDADLKACGGDVASFVAAVEARLAAAP
ncbi:MAG: hypothetical protein CMH55_00910 [Myxococcales bacterium]|nr:hypothetical protein [Myxococcales bacterium]